MVAAMVPLGLEQYGTLAIILSVISIIYASCIALVQTDLTKAFAYSSIACRSISAGMFTHTKMGIQGALIQMFSHGIIVVRPVFYIADILYRRTRTQDLAHMGGIGLQSSFLASAFMIIMLGSIALPLTSGFVRRFLLINSVFQVECHSRYSCRIGLLY